MYKVVKVSDGFYDIRYRYSRLLYLFEYSHVYKELEKLENELKSRGIQFDILTLIQMGIDSYRGSLGLCPKS